MFHKYCVVFRENCVVFHKYCVVFRENCVVFRELFVVFQEYVVVFADMGHRTIKRSKTQTGKYNAKKRKKIRLYWNFIRILFAVIR